MSTDPKPTSLTQGPEMKMFWFLALACTSVTGYFVLNEGNNLFQFYREFTILPDGWRVVAVTGLMLLYFSLFAWVLLLTLHRPAARVIKRRLKPICTLTVPLSPDTIRQALSRLAVTGDYLLDQLPDGTFVFVTRPSLRDLGYLMPVYLTQEPDQTRLELDFWARTHPLLILLDPRRWFFMADPLGTPNAIAGRVNQRIQADLKACLMPEQTG